jgi:hypothetical protein
VPDTRKHTVKSKSDNSTPGPASAFVSTAQGDVSTSSLVLVAWEEILRIHKIPLSWVRCEVCEPKPPSKYSGLEIQMIVSHWSDQLAMYAPALENQLRMQLNWYQPSTDHSKHIVSWRYGPNCGCPRVDIPDNISWEDEKSVAAAVPPDSLLDHRGNIRLG